MVARESFAPVNTEHGTVLVNGKSDPLCLGNGAEIDRPAFNTESVSDDKSDYVSAEHAEKNRDDLEHSLAPDVEHDNKGKSDESKRPI